MITNLIKGRTKRNNSINTYQKKQVFPGAKKLLEGNVKEINPQFSIEEQTELLPYDKAWEFPRCRLTLGSFLL